MSDWVPMAPTFGKDAHYYPEAKTRTPVQLELGDEEYARVKGMWRRYCKSGARTLVVNNRMCARLEREDR